MTCGKDSPEYRMSTVSEKMLKGNQLRANRIATPAQTNRTKQYTVVILIQTVLFFKAATLFSYDSCELIINIMKELDYAVQGKRY